MARNNKNLAFKDISARLPYGVRVKVWLPEGTTEEGVLDLNSNYGDVLRDAFYGRERKITDIKPYLRPLESMTKDEECALLKSMFGKEAKRFYMEDGFLKAKESCVDGLCSMEFFNLEGRVDWLNEHHFDWRGLIKKGLALEAPEGMYGVK